MDTHPGPWLARCRIGAVVLDGQGRLFQRHAIGKSGPRLAAVDHSSPYQLQRDPFRHDLHRVCIVYDFVCSHLTKSTHHAKFITVRPSIELRPSYYFKCKKMYQQRRTDATDHLHRSVEGICEYALRLWATVPAASTGTPSQLPLGELSEIAETTWSVSGRKRAKEGCFRRLVNLQDELAIHLSIYFQKDLSENVQKMYGFAGVGSNMKG